MKTPFLSSPRCGILVPRVEPTALIFGGADMAFTTAQVDLMNRTLEEEPDIKINALRKAIGSSNWQAVKDFIGKFKSEAETVVPDSGDDFPMNRLYNYSEVMEEPEDIILNALDTIILTANLAVTEARELLERRNRFLAMQLESRKQWLEGYITVK